MFVAYEILYNIGFFGLLYSAYTLITNRYVLSVPAIPPLTPHSVALTRTPPNDLVSRTLRKRFLFRIILMAAVALGITGVVEASSAPSLSTGDTLRRVAIYIFLVCAFLVFVQTLILARAEFSGMSPPPLSPLFLTIP